MSPNELKCYCFSLSTMLSSCKYSKCLFLITKDSLKSQKNMITKNHRHWLAAKGANLQMKWIKDISSPTAKIDVEIGPRFSNCK